MTTQLFGEIYERLDKNGFKPEIDDDKIPRWVVFKVPAGDIEYNCTLYNSEYDLRALINSEIEKFSFIEGYKAIWSSSSKKIECEIIPANFNHSFNLHSVMTSNLDIFNSFLPESKKIPKSSKPTKIGNTLVNVIDEVEFENLEFESVGNIKVTIGLCSQEFAVLRGCRWLEVPMEFERFQKNKWTLKLSDINVNSHDEARKLMLKIANSFLFQIDLLTDISIMLVTDSENRFFRKVNLTIQKLNESPDFKLKAPKYEYNDEAISLYWYAKSAENMPLLQFLAYYQVI